MERRKICRFFEKGSCKKENCPFVHLRQSRKNCEYFMRGFCKRGDNCNFYHPPKEAMKQIQEKTIQKPKYQQQVYKDHSEQQEQPQTNHPPSQNQQKTQHPEQQNSPQVHQQSQEKRQSPVQQRKLLNQEQVRKVNKINYLLGLSSSSESSDEQPQVGTKPKSELQFFKIYPWRFPDLSKTIEFKQRVAKNEERYFKDGFMNVLKKLQYPAEKEHYQIIRKFQDSFCESQQTPRIYTLNIMPLLYDQQINFHFPFQDETINVRVDCSQYPQKKAEILFLNQSIPIQYRSRMGVELKKCHERRNLFQTLKYLQNKFEEMYYQTKFKLQNQHFSEKEMQKKVKQVQRKMIATEQQQQAKRQRKLQRQRRKKVRQQDQNREVTVIPYKEGEKIDISSINYEITVQSTFIQNCQYIMIGKILLYIECFCENQIMYILDASQKKELKVGIKLKCRKCQNMVVVCLVREIVQIRANVLARMGIDNGRLLDIGGIAWKVGCTCDNQVRETKLLLPGIRVNINCHHCFQSMALMYSGVKFLNQFLKELQIQNGKELPNKGCCKHKKLSFRYFRYGCCGRLFSCDECHMLGSIRKHENIQGVTMLCGYCSHQQPIQKQCVKCKKDLVRGIDKTGHWEGGMGCRDPTQLSRKDNKKFVGLTKKKQKQQQKQK